DKCDIVFVPSNDERIEFREYKIYNILLKGILSCYISYGYYVTKDDSFTIVDTPNLCWKIFVENALNLEDLKERQPIHGKNAVVTGYPKADAFFGLTKTTHKRKKIIIAPHHSIHGYGLQGQFLKYSELFLKLPKIYPQIDFIFRPHPLLYYTLIQQKYWGEEKTKEYFNEISSYSNCIYDTDPNYYQTFIDSDGIIHDCGSFLPEYLFTPNPPCYMLRDLKAIDEYFNAFGKRCLEYYYKAFNQDDIIKYIEDIVIKGNDPLRSKRENFAKKNVKYNYPNASEKIVKYIKQQFI
nr:CDP-glycerol glycerophosphotransferase family protein [Alphaproteobacteria bacterium]